MLAKKKTQRHGTDLHQLVKFHRNMMQSTKMWHIMCGKIVSQIHEIVQKWNLYYSIKNPESNLTRVQLHISLRITCDES